MKRYLLFGYRHYYPAGGWQDFLGDFENMQEANTRGKEAADVGAWVSVDKWHVVDTKTGKIIFGDGVDE